MPQLQVESCNIRLELSSFPPDCDIVHVFNPDTGFAKAVARRGDREDAGRMLLPRKPFLFAEGHNPAVTNQRSRWIRSFEQKTENNRTVRKYFEPIHLRPISRRSGIPHRVGE